MVSSGSFLNRMKDINIPEQHEGAHSDTVSEITLPTDELAAEFFEGLKQRFLNINCWESYAGREKANFQLYDSTGKPVDRQPQVDDYFRIGIPGPNNEAGEGYDWVQVEEIREVNEKHKQSVYMRVRPTAAPVGESNETAHFFAEQATSNFLITRNGAKITAEVHGRNEKPNIEDVGLLDKIRNTVVAIGGILIGSKFQWKALTDGLLEDGK